MFSFLSINATDKSRIVKINNILIKLLQHQITKVRKKIHLSFIFMFRISSSVVMMKCEVRSYDYYCYYFILCMMRTLLVRSSVQCGTAQRRRTTTRRMTNAPPDAQMKPHRQIINNNK